MSNRSNWYFPREQPGIQGRTNFHAIVVGRVTHFPEIAPIAESGVQGEYEREILRSEQRQFLQAMASMEELESDILPSFDLRIGVFPHPGSGSQLMVAVVGRATSDDKQEAEGFAQHMWKRLSTAFPSNYDFASPTDEDQAFLQTILSSPQELEQTRIWELEKTPYVAYYGDGVIETVGTYSEFLDSMLVGWNTLANNSDRLLLSIRCTPITMSDELRGQLDYLYHFINGGTFADTPMNTVRAQDAPLIEDARHRLEHLLRSMQLLQMRIQLVSWGSTPNPVMAAIRASLTTPYEMKHRSCECQWTECRRDELDRARDELAYVMIDDTSTSDTTSLWRSSERLLSIEEASGAWRFPLARKSDIAGIQFKRNARFTQDAQRVQSGKQGDTTIQLGTVINRRGDNQRQEVSATILSKHVLIAGEPGSGKSTTTQSLVYQLWNNGIPGMVIDPVSTEYRELWQLSSSFRDGPKSLCVFTPGAPGDVGMTLAFNPFCPQPGTSLDSHILLLKDCFGSALALPDSWKELIGRAIRNVYQKMGWGARDLIQNRQPIIPQDIRERPFPTFVDFIKAVEEETVRFKSSEFRTGTEAGLLGRLHDLEVGPLGSLMHTRRPLDVARLVERPVIIELGEISQANAKSLIMLFLLTQLRQYYKGFSRSGGLKHVVVVEEAHRLLSPSVTPQDAESNARTEAITLVTDMLAELRKLGVGMVLVEQLPSRLEKNIVKLPSIKIMHRLPAQDDREMLASAMNMSVEQTKYPTTLSPGQAAFYSEGLVEPILLQMTNAWGTEITPAGRRAKPQTAQEQLALQKEVDDHTLHVWPIPSTDENPWNPCSICQCECKPRLNMLEKGWWRKIELSDIVDELLHPSGKSNLEDLVTEAFQRLEKAVEQLNSKTVISDDDKQCSFTLALEYCVHRIAMDKRDRKEVQAAQKAIDDFLQYVYRRYNA